jgi:transposase
MREEEVGVGAPGMTIVGVEQTRTDLSAQPLRFERPRADEERDDAERTCPVPCANARTA